TGSCAGQSVADVTTAFRIGADCLKAPELALPAVLPQPYYPGVGSNPTAGDGALLDSNFKQDRSDAVNFTIQRQFSHKMVMELGYIGRKIDNEYELINIDAVPYMTTLGGQTFAQAYANLYTQVCALSTLACAGNTTNITAQPFFEAALGGPSSAFCSKSANCTAAIVANSQMLSNLRSTLVYNLWTNLGAQSSWTLGRTLLGS